jgi:hypothetical protein
MENLHLGHEDDIINHASGRGKVHKYMKTHGSEGATEPGRGGPRPVGPGWSAQAGRPSPLRGSVRPPPPLPCTQRIFNPKALEAPPFAGREPFVPGGHPQARERGGRSPEGDQPPRRKHPQVEKKEDTVGRVTMINGAMSRTLMG